MGSYSVCVGSPVRFLHRVVVVYCVENWPGVLGATDLMTFSPLGSTAREESGLI